VAIGPRFLLCAALLFAATSALAEFSHRTDLSYRADDRSDRPFRSQYRLRFQPNYQLSDRWSMHGFVATGDNYDNAWNTVSDNDDVLNVRRAFLRYAVGGSKIEAGVIPPFKGRVSSIGLSKEGWIRGARGVLSTESGRWELVLGELDALDARFATSSDFSLNYIELEYSSQLRGNFSYEIGAEEFFDDRFVRGELRYEQQGRPTVSLELIRNLSTQSSKVILSSSTRLTLMNTPLSWFTFYAYAGEEFGQRAVLSEDFVEFGNSVSSELKGPLFSVKKARWFARVDLYEEISRFIVGLEVRLD